MENILPTNVEQTPTKLVVESKNHSSKMYVTDFPSLPAKKEVRTRSSSVSSQFSSISEDSVGMVTHSPQIVQGVVERGLARNEKIRLTIAYDCIAFHYLDARDNNIETPMRKGWRCTIDDIEYFEGGEAWLHVRSVDAWVTCEAFSLPHCVPLYRETESAKPVSRVVPKVQEVVKCPFSYGETVDCFVNKMWMTGTVLGTNGAITVKIGEETLALHADQIRKTRTRTFTLLIDSCVRQKPVAAGFACASLKKGTEIEVVNVVGQYARINAPTVGWLRCRTDQEVLMLETDYLANPKPANPTLKIFGAENATQQEILECLSGRFAPEMRGAKVIELVNRNEKRFVVSFNKRWEAATVLRKAKSGEYKLRGQVLTMEWALPYLRHYSFSRRC